MNHVFHYHVTALVALQAGFSPKDAELLAWAARQVDLQQFPMTVRRGGTTWSIPRTHHLGPADGALAADVWAPFHFFPSGEASCPPPPDSESPFLAAWRGKWSPWCVTPHSLPLKEITIAAFRTGDPVRMGIALHVLADSWAHQGFSGRLDDMNHLPGVPSIPAMGHACASTRPDSFHLVWQDSRREDPWVENTPRFLAAARCMYRYLRTFLGKDFRDESGVLEDLAHVWGYREEGINGKTRDPALQAGALIRNGTKYLAHTLDKARIRLPRLLDATPPLEEGYREGPPDNAVRIRMDRLLPFPADSTDRRYHAALEEGNGKKGSVPDPGSAGFRLKGLARKLGLFGTREWTGAPDFGSSDLCRFGQAALDHLELCRQVFLNI